MRLAAHLKPATGQAATHVEHLDELRSRLLVSLAALGGAFAVCFSQRTVLLRLIGAPLESVPPPVGSRSPSERAVGLLSGAVNRLAGAIAAPGSGAAPALRGTARSLHPALLAATRASAASPIQRPVTLGVGEPFTTTITVTLLFAFALALPVLLVQLYAFIAPAAAPPVRRALRSSLWAAPVLFVAGASFAYFIVLPATLRFLLTFDGGSFTVLVQAGQYYRFAATTIVSLGVLFQVPLAIVALSAAGVVTPGQLRANRRYAVAACAAVAALLPGEVVTMLLETVPLYLLFELGVAAAAITQRRSRRAAEAVPAQG